MTAPPKHVFLTNVAYGCEDLAQWEAERIGVPRGERPTVLREPTRTQLGVFRWEWTPEHEVSGPE